MSDNHSHHNHSSKNLKVAFFLNLSFTIFEFIGGLYVNSIAIVSDAVHDLGDTLSLGTSWYLDHKSKGSANEKFTYGYKRFSLLGALINCVVLVIGSTYMIYEAIHRLFDPQHSNAQGMIIFAIIGVLVNGYGALKVSKGTTINEKVVSLHLIEDVLGWVAVLIIAIVLYFYDNHYLDPTLSLLITLYILYNVLKRLKEVLYIFLQGVPKSIDIKILKKKILNIDTVDSLYNLHLWSLDGQNHVFSTHVIINKVDKLEQISTIKKEVDDVLKKYNFYKTTIEVELKN